jgi:hypothetical protein
LDIDVIEIALSYSVQAGGGGFSKYLHRGGQE